MGKRNERGAATVEHVGVIVLVVAIIGAVILAATPVGQTIAARLCQAVGATCGDVSAAESGETQYQPDACMYHEESEKFSGSVSLGVFRLGQDTAMIVSRTSDGKIKVTATQGASAGAGGGVGGKFSVDGLDSEHDSGMRVDFGGGFEVGYGDTWTFDDEAQYESFREQLHDYVYEQRQLHGPDAQGFSMGLLIKGGGTEPPDVPSERMSSLSLDAAVDVGLGQQIVGDDSRPSKDADFDPNLGASFSAAGGGKVVVTSDDEGSKSYTYQLEGTTGRSADYVVGDHEEADTAQGSFTVKRDSSGDVTSVQFMTAEKHASTSSAEAGGDGGTVSASDGESASTVTTTTLDVTDDNRGVVDEWLSQRGDALNIPSSAVLPTEESDDPFDQLMYDEAKVSEVDYSNITDSIGFDESIKAGLTFGFGFGVENSVAEATDARYLGAPTGSGTREMVSDASCLEALG